MINHHIRAALATEQQNTLLAEAQAARQAKQARLSAAPDSRLVRFVSRLRSDRRARHAAHNGPGVLVGSSPTRSIPSTNTARSESR
jgi:hypothetical protein